MKLFTKICLMICLLFICIGSACLGAAAFLGSGLKEVWAMADSGELDIGFLADGWHIPYFIAGNGWKYEEKAVLKKQFPADEVKNLEIDIKYGKIRLTDSSTDQIEITVNAPKNIRYTCDFDGSTIELLEQEPRNLWKFWRGRHTNATATIAIPKGKAFDKTALSTDAGTIDISHAVLASEADFELDAGELKAEKVEAENLSVDIGAGEALVKDFLAESMEVSCGAGKAKLSGSVSKTAEADCGVGSIVLELQGKETDFDYEINCGVGNVSVNGQNYSALSVDWEIDNHAGKEIRLDCGVGEIEFITEEAK